MSDDFRNVGNAFLKTPGTFSIPETSMIICGSNCNIVNEKRGDLFHRVYNAASELLHCNSDEHTDESQASSIELYKSDSITETCTTSMSDMCKIGLPRGDNNTTVKIENDENICELEYIQSKKIMSGQWKDIKQGQLIHNIKNSEKCGDLLPPVRVMGCRENIKRMRDTNDVLSGRSHHDNGHPGNKRSRASAPAQKEPHIGTPTKDNPLYSKGLVGDASTVTSNITHGNSDVEDQINHASMAPVANKLANEATKVKKVYYALTGIRNPHKNDVLSGRGNHVNKHPGNEQFRAYVFARRGVYFLTPKKDKPFHSREIVDIIRNLTPPGRFLKQDLSTGLWDDIGDKIALNKTRQALRENFINNPPLSSSWRG